MVGTVSALAAFCAVMPYAWMNATHQYLGMGVLSDQPVVGYLTRSTSAFYALFGGPSITWKGCPSSGVSQRDPLTSRSAQSSCGSAGV
jgi:hypothetical protein